MHQHLLRPAPPRPAPSHHALEQNSLFCGDSIPNVGGQAVCDLRTNEGPRGRDSNSRLAKLSRRSKPMVMSCSLRCLNPGGSQAVGMRNSNSQGPSRKWEGALLCPPTIPRSRTPHLSQSATQRPLYRAERGAAFLRLEKPAQWLRLPQPVMTQLNPPFLRSLAQGLEMSPAAFLVFRLLVNT